MIVIHANPLSASGAAVFRISSTPVSAASLPISQGQPLSEIAVAKQAELLRETVSPPASLVGEQPEPDLAK